MDDLALARAVHVIAVMFWIGGVGFVTWVVMPALRASEHPADRRLGWSVRCRMLRESEVHMAFGERFVASVGLAVGQLVRVQLVETNVQRGFIDFVLGDTDHGA